MNKQLLSELRFPETLSLLATGGPSYSTSLVETSGGFEQRNINWTTARMSYNIAPAIRTQEDLELVIFFFRLQHGKAHGLRFKDWTDYKTRDNLIAIADGVTTTYPLYKRYGKGKYYSLRRISHPILKTVKIYVNRVLEANVTVSPNGEVTFTQPPAKDSRISADFEFDVYVRFNTDQLTVSTKFNYINNLDIPLIEIKQ